MKRDVRFLRRSASGSVLIVGGGAIAVATWVSGDRALAWVVGAFYVVAAIIVTLWSRGRGDVAAILRVDGDERQRGMDRDATAITGLAMALAAIVGAVVQLARTGDPGAYGLLCVVGGVSYAVSLTFLRRRR